MPKKKITGTRMKPKGWREAGVVRLTIELPQALVDEMGAAADAKGLKPSHIIRLWLIERAAVERQQLAALAVSIAAGPES